MLTKKYVLEFLKRNRIGFHSLRTSKSKNGFFLTLKKKEIELSYFIEKNLSTELLDKQIQYLMYVFIKMY